MACHLSHKLPWENLHEIFMSKPRRDAYPPHCYPRYTTISLTQKKTLDHFSRCLAAAIQEFIDTDRSAEEERNVYDPWQWVDEQRAHGAGAWLGFYDTLPYGYVELNMLLLEPDEFPRRMWHGGKADWVMECLLGMYDGGHDEPLASHLREAFNGSELKPRSGDVQAILRAHAAKMFRCMYSISGDNDLLNPAIISRKLMHWGNFRCREDE